MKKTLFAKFLLSLCFVPFARPAAADAPAWMHAAAAAPLPPHDEKTDAILLYAEDITTVTPDGKTKGIERRVYKILRPEGREYGDVYGYVGRDTKIGSMKGWCIPAQGKDYEVKDKDITERSIGASNGELVSDIKVRYFRIPAAEPGNVVGYEIEYQSRPYVLQDDWQVQDTIPVREARYTLQMPPGWRFRSVWLNHQKVDPQESGNNEYRWVVTDLPPVRHERRMPPMSGLMGRMIVSFLSPNDSQQSGFLTWDDMGKWATQLAAGRRDPSAGISQEVSKLTASLQTPQQKMAEVAKFIQKEIRYVAIELGIGGWQPHSATDIFAHRYGDCKDKATLLSSMLKQAGVDSYYLVINTHRGAVGPDTPPMMYLFNHMILAVKLPPGVMDSRYEAIFDHPKLGKLLVFDPTDEKTPFGHLRSELQGNYSLLLTPEGGELVRTPQLPPGSNGISHNGHFTLDANGTLKGDVNVMRKGDFATFERYEQISVANSKDRLKRIEQEVSHSIGMFEITKAQMLNLDVTDQPFGYAFDIVANSYAKHAGNLLTVRPRVMGVRSSDIMEEKEPRKFPVVFAGPEKDVDTYEIALPAGYDVEDLPAPTDVDFSFASYHSKTEKKGDTLVYSRLFEVKELSVPLEKLDELKKFYRAIASDERGTAVLKPKS